MSRVRIGIVGGAGYTGGEMLRILLGHPHAEIVFVHSKSHAGDPVYKAHGDLVGETELHFTDTLQKDIDVLFLCVGHGEASVFLKENALPDHIRIIDLSQDFRLKEKGNNGFVYGLPELNRSVIQQAVHIANPGCFATCIQLGLLPLAAAGKLKNDVHVTAITGSTGAGQKLTATSHFSWRNNNMSVYKAFTHQHLGEINQSLQQLDTGRDASMHFIPYRGDFTRGIIASSYTSCPLSLEEAREMYNRYYETHPFVHQVTVNPDLKQVVNTNKCIVYLEKHEDQLLIISMIDNLVKGASGQAVQNMNLIMGLEEKEGLYLKPIGF
ncbi:MAG: N-acetyl-gamma-glutamyl-phosphate reductase [Flavobacteriales bacterium]|nr:N-acetyl-gamma-glutamyl-phosphate reductase [Flavobacteriales bacterium]MCB9449489.1 N-acetyl-gamma-glutamyl-phosphate reductase [Flavobacteriales bacterium]